MKLIATLGAATTVALLCSAAATDGTPVQDDAAVKTAAGKITGRIVFDGKAPEAKPLTIKEDQAKGCCAPGEKVNDQDLSLVLDEKGGIANVVVQLTVEGAKVDVPEEPMAFDQQNCRFTPHVLVVPVGATVKYLNSDGISHNIHTYAVKNKADNKTVAAGTNFESDTLEKAEPVKVACDIHPWMQGWVYVTEHTHWTLSGRDGSFTLENVPPGDYTLEIWHEKLGKSKQKVTVKADGTADAVEVKMGEKKKGGGRRRR